MVQPSRHAVTESAAIAKPAAKDAVAAQSDQPASAQQLPHGASCAARQQLSATSAARRISTPHKPAGLPQQRRTVNSKPKASNGTRRTFQSSPSSRSSGAAALISPHSAAAAVEAPRAAPTVISQAAATARASAGSNGSSRGGEGNNSGGNAGRSGGRSGGDGRETCGQDACGDNGGCGCDVTINGFSIIDLGLPQCNIGPEGAAAGSDSFMTCAEERPAEKGPIASTAEAEALSDAAKALPSVEGSATVSHWHGPSADVAAAAPSVSVTAVARTEQPGRCSPTDGASVGTGRRGSASLGEHAARDRSADENVLPVSDSSAAADDANAGRVPVARAAGEEREDLLPAVSATAAPAVEESFTSDTWGRRGSGKRPRGSLGFPSRAEMAATERGGGGGGARRYSSGAGHPARGSGGFEAIRAAAGAAEAGAAAVPTGLASLAEAAGASGGQPPLGAQATGQTAGMPRASSGAAASSGIDQVSNPSGVAAVTATGAADGDENGIGDGGSGGAFRRGSGGIVVGLAATSGDDTPRSAAAVFAAADAAIAAAAAVADEDDDGGYDDDFLNEIGDQEGPRLPASAEKEECDKLLMSIAPQDTQKHGTAALSVPAATAVAADATAVAAVAAATAAAAAVPAAATTTGTALPGQPPRRLTSSASAVSESDASASLLAGEAFGRSLSLHEEPSFAACFAAEDPAPTAAAATVAAVTVEENYDDAIYSEDDDEAGNGYDDGDGGVGGGDGDGAAGADGGSGDGGDDASGSFAEAALPAAMGETEEGAQDQESYTDDDF
ncbi:unnamed protein product [Phaeothamnion confervicola]